MGQFAPAGRGTLSIPLDQADPWDRATLEHREGLETLRGPVFRASLVGQEGPKEAARESKTSSDLSCVRVEGGGGRGEGR